MKSHDGKGRSEKTDKADERNLQPLRRPLFPFHPDPFHNDIRLAQVFHSQLRIQLLKGFDDFHHANHLAQRLGVPEFIYLHGFCVSQDILIRTYQLS